MAIWKVWIPAQTINFAFMPMWARIPFTTMVSFGWTCYVSIVRGAPEVEESLEEQMHHVLENAALVETEPAIITETPIVLEEKPGDEVATCAHRPKQVYMAATSYCGYCRKAVAAHEKESIGTQRNTLVDFADCFRY